MTAVRSATDLADEVVGDGVAAPGDRDHVGLGGESRTVLAPGAEAKGHRKGEGRDPVVVVPGENFLVLFGDKGLEEGCGGGPFRNGVAEHGGQALVAYRVCFVEPEIDAVRAGVEHRLKGFHQLLQDVRVAQCHKSPCISAVMAVYFWPLKPSRAALVARARP